MPSTRRHVLKGLGVSVTLPFLPSLARAAEQGDGQSPPKRFGVFFYGDGICPPHYWVTNKAEGLELGPCLQPMAPHVGDCTFVHGLYNMASRNVDNHPGQTGNILSGVKLPKGATIRAGISLDQVIARHFAEQTAMPSLVLSCDQPSTGMHFNGYSTLFSSHISWARPEAPVPLELYPALAWDSLFDNRGPQRLRSVLDRVHDQAKRLQVRLSGEDGRHLDSYLTSVRELEQRVERARKEQLKAAERGDGRPLLVMPRPESGLPADLAEHVRLMMDLVVVAFQTDRTRVASLIINRDLSMLLHDHLGARAGHHALSHQCNGAMFKKITTWNIAQFAYLVDRLKQIPEGQGRLIDNCSLLCLSNMWAGNKHDSTNIPVILAGGLAAGAGHGRYLDQSSHKGEKRLCSLYLDLLHGLGIPMQRFGDADCRLPGFAG